MSDRVCAEPALAVGDDPVSYAATLERVYQAMMNGDRGPARPRELIAESWRRMRRAGLPADQPSPDIDTDALAQDSDRSRTVSGHCVEDFAGMVSYYFAPVLNDSRMVAIFATPGSRIGLRLGSSTALNRANRIQFVRGATWNETSVGTNAVFAAGQLHRPVQIHGPEHWCLNQHSWSCSAAPVRNPRSGEIFGILDLSGPVDEAHPALLGLVHSLAGQIELIMQRSALRHYEVIRSHAWATTARLPGPWALVDDWGWVVGTREMVLGERLEVTERLAEGPGLIRGIGAVEITRLGYGLLVRPYSGKERWMRFKLCPERSELIVEMANEPTKHHLSPRHNQILQLLVRRAEPLTAEDVAEAIWGADNSNISSTARVEMHRIRKRFPGLVSASPYRLEHPVEIVSADGIPRLPQG